jgi:hypothetical protein
VYLNGSLVGTDTSYTGLSAGIITQLNFDRGDGANDFYGKCKDIRYYDTEGMTDTEITNLLTQLTQ